MLLLIYFFLKIPKSFFEKSILDILKMSILAFSKKVLTKK
jgi:hypothetical protein